MATTRSNKSKKSECSTVINVNISLDLIFDILSRLPIKPCLRFKSVCKSWYALIRSPDFSKMHFTRSIKDNNNDNNKTLSIVTATFDSEKGIYSLWLQSSGKNPYLVYTIEMYHAPRILGICDGLFCATFGDDYDAIICNPTTGGPVFRTSRFSLPLDGELDSLFFAFGGVQTQESYDLFLFRVFYSSACLDFCGEMYLVSVGAWRKIEVKRGEGVDARRDLCSIVFFNSPPVTINEVFYRRAYISNVPYVVSFQVNGYVIDMIACPEELSRVKGVHWHLVDLSGELALLFSGRHYLYNKCIELGVLNEIDKSWTIKVSVAIDLIQGSLKILGYTKNDNFVMQRDLPNSEVALFAYDPKSRNKRYLPFTGLQKGCDFYLYTESLLSV